MGMCSERYSKLVIYVHLVWSLFLSMNMSLAVRHPIQVTTWGRYQFLMFNGREAVIQSAHRSSPNISVYLYGRNMSSVYILSSLMRSSLSEGVHDWEGVGVVRLDPLFCRVFIMFLVGV